MAQGVLSGKYLPGQPPPEGSRGADDRVNKQVKDYLTDDKLQKAQAFKQLAEKHGMLPSNLALAFCLQNPHVAAVLVGARTKEQLKENLKAVDLAVSPELMSELDAMFPVA
jgi:aryl-alcohol dehydrogenase-like predicted oxidoreductase